MTNCQSSISLNLTYVRKRIMRAAELVTAVGPAIGPCCYEVGPEVIAAISTSQRDPDRLLAPSPNPGKAHLDLWEANAQQFRDAGVHQIEIAGLCTACHNDIFFSHRGDKGHSGRFAAFFMLENCSQQMQCDNCVANFVGKAI